MARSIPRDLEVSTATTQLAVLAELRTDGLRKSRTLQFLVLELICLLDLIRFWGPEVVKLAY